MENIISINGLNKTFKVHERDKGFLQSVKSVFYRKYKLIKAVDDVNLEIKKGEIRALIGPNGAGKSSLIKIMSGILFPTSGNVSIMGLNPWKDRNKYIKNIGVLFGQKSQLIWELPAIDTFGFHKKMYNISDGDFKENMDFFIDILKIETIIRKPVRNLSLGERMRCEIVCALLHNPLLVFLDEPTIGLDLSAKAAIRTLVKKINKEKNITFILTTHDLNDVENLCDRITIINCGKIIYNDFFHKLKTLSEKKIIEVVFYDPIGNDVMDKWNMRKIDDNTAKFEIDTLDNNFKDVMNNLVNNYKVKDINMNSIDIETIIGKIYEKKN